MGSVTQAKGRLVRHGTATPRPRPKYEAVRSEIIGFVTGRHGLDGRIGTLSDNIGR
jgi:hypothetical protein